MARGVLLGLIAALVLAAPAWGGTYQVNACAGGGGNFAWVPFRSNAAFDVISGCPFTVRSTITPSRRAGNFEAAWWRLTAPPGTVVDRLRITRWGRRFSQGDGEVVGGVHQGGWVSEAYTEDGQIRYGFGAEACVVPPSNIGCEWGNKSAAADLDLDATQVTYQVACIVSSGCDTSNNAGTAFAELTIYNAVATIRDDVPPALSAGGPLLAGGWHRPDTPLSVDATDVTGISAVSATAGAASGSLATPCDYTRMVPCANAHGSFALSGLGDGTYPVTITVKDAAGNPATAVGTLNVDGTAPDALLRKPSGRTLAVAVGDALSGVASGTIFAGATPLPTTLGNGRLTAHLPSGNPSRADVHVTVTDNAGNTTSGIPPRLSVPSRKTLRFGHRGTLRGRLTTPAGAPLAGVAVQAVATLRRRGAAPRPAGVTTTGRRGRFALRLPAGASRTLRVVVPATGATLRAVRDLAVRVRASSTIRASRRVVGPGDVVRFSGRIRRAGQRLPAHGLVVILQGRSAGAWRTFADARTTRAGRWHARYRFHGIPGSYPVRLRIRRADGFPFTLGYSPVTTVRVL